MPGPLDDALKHLTELSPQDWVVQGGWPAAPVTLADADIATITGATDKVIRVAGPPDWLLAVDFQAGHDALKLPPKMLLYNAALRKRHELHVRSLAVILHRDADSPQLTGLYESDFPNELPDVTLRYRVVRVWQVPAERWLAGGLGVLPLAPLGAVAEVELPAVIAQMKDRLDREVTRSEAAELWSATYILMGLRYADALIETLLQGVLAMEDSVTYQKILRKGLAQGVTQGLAQGRAEEARRLLLLLGRKHLGEPSADARTALESLTDVDQLEELTLRLTDVSSWQELLGLPG
jgi:predicted transposase YdaD